MRERCGVTAGVNSVYNFVRVREKAVRGKRPKQHNSGRPTETGASTGLPERAHSQPRTPTGNDTWKNIEKLKQGQSAPHTGEKVFVYNEDEPLKLVRGPATEGGGDKAPLNSST